MRRVMQSRLNNVFVPATQSDQETGTDAVRYVSPETQQHHRSGAKAWAHILLSGTTPVLITGYNVASVSGPATGVINIAFTNPMASAFYCGRGTVIFTSGSTNATVQIGSSSTSGTFVVYVKNGSTGTLFSNYVGVNVEVHGLLA